MTATGRDVEELVKKLRYDLTAAQAKLTDLSKMLADLPLPEPERFVCPDCKAGLPSERRLVEHRWNVHDVPEAS